LRKLIASAMSLSSAFVLIIVILLTVIEMCVFDLNFYLSEFNKIHSAEVIGISAQDLKRTTEGLLAYIQGQRNNLEIEAMIKGEKREVFNQKEKTHMADVRRLYASSHKIRNIGLIFLIFLLTALRWAAGPKFLKFWAGGYLTGAIVIFCVVGVLALAVFGDFFQFWNYFHTLFFTNDLWILDPDTDILIQIVPEQFFFDLTVRILTFFTAMVSVLTVICAAILFKKGKSTVHQ